MEIERHTIPTMSLQELAYKYGLKLVVRERNRSLRESGLPRFYVHLHKVEEKEGIMLRSTSGNGETEQDAILDYCENISGSFLVYDAMGQNRIEIGHVYIEEA